MQDIDKIVKWSLEEWLHTVAATKQVLPFEVHPLLRKHALAWGGIALPARITLERDEDGEPIWALHPDPERASKKSWVWLVIVRAGFSSAMLERHHPGKFFEKWLEDCAMIPTLRAYMNAINGPEKIDIVAVSPDLKKCHGALMKMANVLGDPQYPECADGPVRVFRDIGAWLEGDCGGVVLLGSERENLDWLRRCEHGIVFDDIKHAEFWQKKLRRPYDGPKVLVAA